MLSTSEYPFLVKPIPHLQSLVSQRSLHNEPIFRLLLKVAVNGTHQCDFLNFCGSPGSQQRICLSSWCSYSHTLLESLTGCPGLTRVSLHIVSSNAVFVFTLDCNNCIYCYDTGDGFLTPAVWLIKWSSLKCHTRIPKILTGRSIHLHVIPSH